MTDTEARARDRRDRLVMLLITIGSGLVITAVLYLAGAFMRSTG